MLRKAHAAARLALSAELLGSDHEARAAGLTAGRLYRAAGVSLDDAWDPWFARGPNGEALNIAWHAIVDGHSTP